MSPLKLFAAVLICSFLLISALSAESVVIPGNVFRLNSYSTFLYNLSPDDYLNYLNERLLFSEMPDERITHGRIREKLFRLVAKHNEIRQFLQSIGADSSLAVSIDVTYGKGLKNAQRLLNLLALDLKYNDEGNHRITPKGRRSEVIYYKFARVDVKVLEEQLNQNNTLYFELQETLLPLPWTFRFFHKVTGFNFDSASFFQNVLIDERLSLLLATLYQLSDYEIEFINDLVLSPEYGAWKEIYENKKLLMGFFVLAHALRVKDGSLRIPGGSEAESFWSELAGEDCRGYPLEFLKSIALKNKGKLNYFYVFSYFLPEEKLKAITFNFDPEKMQEILKRVSLGNHEKISGSRIPQLENFNYFTMLYSLREKDGRIQFPGGTAAWLAALTESKPKKDNNDIELEFFITLLEETKKSNEASSLQKFTSLYTKFFERPSILTEDIIRIFYQNYSKFNVLIDFIEKIPIQNPNTVNRLFQWLNSLDRLNETERDIFTALYQSLFEIISHKAVYTTGAIDFDQLVLDLIQIPLARDSFPSDFFKLIENNTRGNLNKENVEQKFFDFVLADINNQDIKIDEVEYSFLIKDAFKADLNDVLQTQEVSSLSVIFEIESLLETVFQSSQYINTRTREQIVRAFEMLVHPGISAKAPELMQKMVTRYLPSELDMDVELFLNHLTNNASKEIVNGNIFRFRGRYLIYHLKDYLLATAYALNAKNEGLKSFYNLNLIRLHDFEGTEEHTRWNFCGEPVISKFPGYYLQGGLSRLNIAIAPVWEKYLFRNRPIYDFGHIQALIINNLEMYPVVQITSSQSYVALLVEFGLELLRKSREDSSLKQDLIDELESITTGYHYRDIVSYLNNKSDNYYLFNTDGVL